MADDYETLALASDLVDEAILLTRKALRRDPAPEPERRLDQRLLDLGEQSVGIERKLDLIFEASPAVTPPTPGQVERMGRLTAEVERHKQQAIMASSVLDVTDRVLTLATELAG